ncbi:MAG: hypothetical protein VKP62_03860 [Candidatus Sericytochromatia bacterium]|nr:hypothetical protein [Candidatus Sericytochromatia bacterium]
MSEISRFRPLSDGVKKSRSVADTELRNRSEAPSDRSDERVGRSREAGSNGLSGGGSDRLKAAAQADLGGMPWTQNDIQERLSIIEARGRLSPELQRAVDQFLEEGGNPDHALAALQSIAKPLTNVDQIPGCSSCAAANAQQMWAATDPSGYFKAATELMKNGRTTIQRDGGEVDLTVNQAGPPPSNSDFIAAQRGLTPDKQLNYTMQAALMNHGAGRGGYSLARDQRVEGGGSGLALREAYRLNRVTGLKTIMGTSVPPEQRNAGDDGLPKGAFQAPERAWQSLENSMNTNGMASVVINQGSGGHVVLVKDISGGQVTFRDATKGSETTLSADQFRSVMDLDPNNVMDDGVGNYTGWGSSATSYAGRYSSPWSLPVWRPPG